MESKRVIERLMDIISLLINRDCEDLGFDGLTIEEISQILGIDEQTVRNDLYYIYAATRLPKGEVIGKKDVPKGGMSLDISDEELDDNHEKLVDAFYDDRSSLDKSEMVNARKYDDFHYCVNADDFTNPLYISLSSEEYDSLVNALKENGFSEKYINMDAREYYKICPEYNDYSSADKDIEEIAMEAISEDRYISFEYRSEDNKVCIKPLRIVRHSRFGVSYIVTLEKGLDRVVPYRTDRMKNVHIVDGEPYEADMSILDDLPYMWSMDYEGRFDVRVRIYNDNNGKIIDKVKRDLEYHKNENGPVYKIENDGDNVIMSGMVIGENAFRAWLRTYGASVEVLEPESLRADMIQEAKSRLTLYSAEA